MSVIFDNVNIDSRKLRDYCLNPNHPVGKHKARVFFSELGLRRQDAGALKRAIIQEIRHGDIHDEREDKYGKRFSAEIKLNMKNREALVKTIWILRTDEKIPSLVTCYVIT